MTTEETKKVAGLNNIFRRSGGGVTVTTGAQNVEDLEGLLRAIRYFADFNEDNDPYGEHDFASIQWNGGKVFWKIDYYNPELTCFENPLSPTCRRVMTVMLAEEY